MLTSNGNIKILAAITQPTNACSFYRGILPLTDLVKRNIARIDVDFLPETQVDWSFLARYDVLYMQRPHMVSAQALMQIAKSIGMKVWIDYDDDLFNVPLANYTWSLYRSPEMRQRIEWLLRVADMVTVSTDALADSYRKYNENMKVIRNAWPLTYQKPDLDKPTPIKRRVAWRGGPSHNEDMADFLPEIGNLMKELGPGWELWAFGAPHWDVAKHVKPEQLQCVPPIEDIFAYFHRFIETQPDVLIVPLTEGPFNRAKSNIAWQEATIAGAAAVVPDWPEWQVPAGKYRENRTLTEATLFAVENRKRLVTESITAIPDYLSTLKERAAVVGTLLQ